MLTLNRTVVSHVAKVNCTDVLIVLWAWHLVATPGRAKQAKVKSASLVKALLTTHPQGESTGSLLALHTIPPLHWHQTNKPKKTAVRWTLKKQKRSDLDHQCNVWESTLEPKRKTLLRKIDRYFIDYARLGYS